MATWKQANQYQDADGIWQTVSPEGWDDPSGMTALGHVSSQGHVGTLYRDAEGKYYVNGVNVPIDDATAQAWVAGNAQARSDEIATHAGRWYEDPRAVAGLVAAAVSGGQSLGVLGSGMSEGAGYAAGGDFLGSGSGGLEGVWTGDAGLTYSGNTDLIGSDWATGQATGATGGVLPTNAGGYTLENLAATQAGGGALSTVAPTATGAAPTTLSAIPGFSALPTAIQTALAGVPLSTAAGLVGALLGGTQGQAADLQTTVTPWAPAQAGIQSGLAATQAQLAKSGSFTPPTSPGASSYNPTLTNEYIQAAIAGALKPLNDQFRTVTMPQIGQNSLANNQFGSSRQAIAEALAANSLQQNSGSIAAQLMNQFTQAQSKDVLATNTLNSDNLWKDFAAKYKSSQDQFNYPWNALSQANNIFQGAGGIAKTTTTPMPETPWWQTAIATGGAAAETAKKLFP